MLSQRLQSLVHCSPWLYQVSPLGRGLCPVTAWGRGSATASYTRVCPSTHTDTPFKAMWPQALVKGLQWDLASQGPTFLHHHLKPCLGSSLFSNLKSPLSLSQNQLPTQTPWGNLKKKSVDCPHPQHPTFWDGYLLFSGHRKASIHSHLI